MMMIMIRILQNIFWNNDGKPITNYDSGWILFSFLWFFCSLSLSLSHFFVQSFSFMMIICADTLLYSGTKNMSVLLFWIRIFFLLWKTKCVKKNIYKSEGSSRKCSYEILVCFFLYMSISMWNIYFFCLFSYWITGKKNLFHEKKILIQNTVCGSGNQNLLFK